MTVHFLLKIKLMFASGITIYYSQVATNLWEILMLFNSVLTRAALGIVEIIFFLFGEGNGNWLHYSCLENPVDRGLPGYSTWGH